MTDLVKIQKLLNLCASDNEAEALGALRLVQKTIGHSLGDYFIAGLKTAPKASETTEYEKLYEAEVDRTDALKKKSDELEKKLRKRENDSVRLKRDMRNLKLRLEDSEKNRLTALDSLAKRDTPGEYEILEKLYGEELEKNEKLRSQLAQRDKSAQKSLHDVSRLKRGKGSEAGRVEELEKMVEDLANEVMDLRDKIRERERS